MIFELAKDEKGLRTGSIDPSWYQGRGAFGGLVGGLLLTAMRDEVADETRTPRSATFHFAGPATEGPFSIATSIMRRGSRVTHATARLFKGEEVATFASASFCAPRTADVAYQTASMPEIAPAESLRAFPADFPGVPTFFQRFDVRFAGPTLPFSGSKTALVRAWVKPKAPLALDAAAAVLLVDTLPPAISATFEARRPVASVDFRVDFFERFDSAPIDGFHLVSIASKWAGDGYTEELRELWTPDGRILAQCRQLLALL